MNPATGRRAILVYVLVTWTVSSLFYFLIIKSSGTNSADGTYTSGLMWCPAIGALLTCKYLGRPIASLGLAVGPNPLPSTQLPHSSRLFHLYLLRRLVDWHRRVKPEPDCRCLFAVLRSRSVGQTFRYRALFPGCRNHRRNPKLRHHSGRRNRLAWILVPALAKHFSFTATAVLSGVIWALWHVPIIVFAGYNMGTGWYGLAVVSANMIGLCFVLTWLRLKSGSVWTGVILHASSNHFIQQFFDPMTAYTGRTKYILGEFGIGFTLVVAVLAAYFWMRRAEVVQPQ